MTALLVLAAQEETHRDLGAPAWVFGVGVFAALVVLLVGTLMFGKGRPHS